MIYITLGTQNNDFTRCLKEFEKVVTKFIITEEVVAQKGYTKYAPVGFKCFDFVSEVDYQKYITSASVVVSHAGSGALFSAISRHKKIIAVARLAQFGEMVNDHQTELVKKLSELGYLVDGTYDMEAAWEKVQSFSPNEERIDCGIIPEIEKILQTWDVDQIQ